MGIWNHSKWNFCWAGFAFVGCSLSHHRNLFTLCQTYSYPSEFKFFNCFVTVFLCWTFGYCGDLIHRVGRALPTAPGGSGEMPGGFAMPSWLSENPRQKSDTSMLSVIPVYPYREEAGRNRGPPESSQARELWVVNGEEERPCRKQSFILGKGCHSFTHTHTHPPHTHTQTHAGSRMCAHTTPNTPKAKV